MRLSDMSWDHALPPPGLAKSKPSGRAKGGFAPEMRRGIVSAFGVESVAFCSARCGMMGGFLGSQ